MRSPVLVFASILALAAACGGKTGGTIGGDGGGSSGSSGGSSGSSSGGVSCKPLPGCDSSVECNTPDGCGTCFCENGSWECTGGGCGDDVADASPPEDAPFEVCPPEPPSPGGICFESNTFCDYPTDAGCGEGCFCANGSWECSANPCPPPSCPPSVPPPGTACSGPNTSCFYPVGDGCGEIECDCDDPGYFTCITSECFDAGPPDTGPPDSGFNDGGGCPGVQPVENGSCLSQGLVCSYFTGCETNCLCSSNGWICANEGPC